MTQRAKLEHNTMDWDKDSGVYLSNNDTWPVGDQKWLNVVPHGLTQLLRLIKRKYDNFPVYILESGFPTNGRLDDTDRINYLYSHMKEVILAMNTFKCNVKG